MSAVAKEQTAIAANTAPSLISRFAQRYNVEPSKLLTTLKATAFYSADGEVTNEQMMALLIVADQYHLNPFTKEIYAFPDKKRGGIVPIVGVDGWARIVNEQVAFDGVEFTDGPASDKHKGAPEWIDCIMHRKDRAHPTSIRERLVECYRDTGPWNSHPARLLRHKAFMQCGRIAFALVGIYDEDEAQRIISGDANGAGDGSPNIAAINDKITGKKAGKKTGATIEGEVQHVETDPTQRQEAELDGIGKQQAGAPTVAQISDQIQGAKTIDDLNLARDLIRYAPEQFRDSLDGDAAAKLAELSK